MKMKPIVSSETSATKSQTPGNYPKRNKLHLQHGESLRTKKIYLFLNISIFLQMALTADVFLRGGQLQRVKPALNGVKSARFIGGTQAQDGHRKVMAVV